MTESPGQQNLSQSSGVDAAESAGAQSTDGAGSTVGQSINGADLDGTRRAAIDPLIGTNLGGRYEVLAAIASGGMGIVYRCRHILMDKVVAIKILNATYANEPGALARFQHEAKVACQLTHPNIVVVHDFGMTDDQMLYLVMDFVEGQTLEQVLDDTSCLPVGRVLAIASQLCDGLEYAHERGLIHRDLKPSNIMIVGTKNGFEQVQILDFGLAKFLGEGKQQALSQTGYVLGSGYYMSPEQCRGKPADVRSEIYAVGCVLYEALVGLPPLVGDNLLETCQKHIEEIPSAMATVRPDLVIPVAVESVVKRALEKDPQARFQSVAELHIALEAARQAVDVDLPEERTTVAQPPKVTGDKALPVNAVPANSEAPSAVHGGPAAFSLVGILLGIAAIGMAVVFYFSGGKLLPTRLVQQPVAPASSPSSTVDASAQTAATDNGAAKEPTTLAASAPSASVSTAWAKCYRQAGKALAEGQYGPAEKLLQQAASEARRSGSKAELLLSLRKLEDALYLQGKFREADAVYPEVRRLTAAAAAAPAEQSALKSAASTDDDAFLSKPSESQDDRIAHLAMSCHKNGQCDTAVSLLEHSVAVAKRMYGPRSLKTATRISELASLYLALDEPGKAQPLMDEVMEIRATQHNVQKASGLSH